tara:strand:- start:8778 stop:9236 length:459 start_codon:yes stop_codon:yes gene_type:complete
MLLFAVFGKIQASEDVQTCQQCPTDKVLLLDPSKGFGKMVCDGPGNSCSKLLNITCVGYSIAEIGQCSFSGCYDWHCHAIPSKMSSRTTINIDGPDYDTIRIDIEEMSMVLILVVIAILFTMCAMSPELTFGVIMGASLFDNDGYDSQHFRS